MTAEIEKRLLEFLDAENKRDWEEYEKYLSDDVEWTTFGPPGRRIVKGKEQYVTTMKNIYDKIHSTFRIVSIATNPEVGTVMAELEMSSRRSVDIFEFKDNLIFREREYYDDSYWLTEFQSLSTNSRSPGPRAQGINLTHRKA